jgi:DNA-binding response OmpR family regulator
VVAGREAQHPAMPLRVGWVDDTALIRQLAVRFIERSGHTCRSFPRHVDLLDADREEPFDVVVLQPEDAVSPCLTQQRLLARCPRRAIALASGHSVERLRTTLDVDPATFDRFIPKPFDPRDLTAWLASLDPATSAPGSGGPRPVMVERIGQGRLFEAPWITLELQRAT